MVYRLKFAPTIFAAQQLVAHGHILVNGKKVDIRSFQVSPGMEISIRRNSPDAFDQRVAKIANREVPDTSA